MYHNVGLALRVVGADELVGDSKLFAERCRPGFFGKEGIRTGFDQAIFDAIGRQAAAKPLPALEERVFEFVSRPRAPFPDKRRRSARKCRRR